VSVQVHEVNERRFIEFNSLPLGDFVQGVVDVREMIRRNVADEGVRDFVVAHAAMQPAEKHSELHGAGNDRGQNGKPGCGHGIPIGVRRLASDFLGAMVNRLPVG
jgi:hypothetical protein